MEGILPLRLSWTEDDEDRSDDEDDTDWGAVGDLVQDHASRWTSIELELEHYDGEEAVLQALCTSHFPHLEYLRVHRSDEALTMGEELRLNLAQCQNLQEVDLPIMPYLPATPSSNSPINLRTLHLNLRSMDSCSSEDLESLLRLTPQLVELKVENLLNDTNPPAPFDAPIIDLPNLLCLKFVNAVTGDEREWIPLLAQIRAPQLENLNLYYEQEISRTGWSLNIDARVVFTVLATWPSASTNRPEDAPLHSVLRNAGPSAAWRVADLGLRIVVTAKSGSGSLHITLDSRHPSHDQLPGHILAHIAPFGLPVDLNIFFEDDETVELEFWDEVLDATPSLRTFEVGSSGEVARQVMDRLSTKAASSSSADPRAPHLEKLDFQSKVRPSTVWSRSGHDEEEAVKTMLDKRREVFIQAGVIDPPKLVVTGVKGFDEAKSHWLA
ncbi:hypothetical protein FRC05_006536 [Tulasnella sp. 425]|nr:hypothetical protein FRC05_006536 [Tulasnella sp. 425]